MIEFNTDAARDMLAILPELLLTLLAFAVIFWDLYTPAADRRAAGYIAAVGMFIIAGIAFLAKPTSGDTLSEQLVLGGMIRTDALANLFSVVVIAVGGLTCMLGIGDKRLRYKGEFYAITIVATIGASLLSAAADIVMVFLALETLSISLYILTGFIRRPVDDDLEMLAASNRSIESGLKYFLFGAFTSGFFLYGLTLLYGFTGQTNIYRMGQVLGTGQADAAPVVVAMLLVTVGFGFKISAVPFHFWTPDVYEGAPTPVTSFLSVASKAASFAVATRFLLAVFPPDRLVEGATENLSQYWVQLVVILSIATMTLGNVLALVQRNIKRLVAYSSIAQAGYTLMGLAAISTTDDGQGVAAVAFYMTMYAMTNTLLFACVILFTNSTGSENISDMAALSRRSPWLAIAMTIALLSLAGIPPAAGFVGKFLLFRAAVDAGLWWLAMIGVINAIIGLYYYLIVIKVMYVNRSPDEDKEIAIPAPFGFVLTATSVIVILLGTLLIDFAVNWANDAGEQIFFALTQNL